MYMYYLYIYISYFIFGVQCLISKSFCVCSLSVSVVKLTLNCFLECLDCFDCVHAIVQKKKVHESIIEA